MNNINLSLNKYHWSKQGNLGDDATDIILKCFLPFLKFDKKEKENLLMFGGTIFDHIKNANILHKANFKKIIFFGVGVSKESEIDKALKTIIENKIKFIFIPRGPKTKKEIEKKGISCEEPVGDVLQMCSFLPLSNSDSDDLPDLLVLDSYAQRSFDLESRDHITIKVANNKLYPNVPYYNFNSFIELVSKCNKVHSSQIHPFLISALLGKPCRLYPKDWRSEDFKYFKYFKLNMTKEDSLKLRLEAQKSSYELVKKLLKHIKEFL
jgi:hypothetical protein